MVGYNVGGGGGSSGGNNHRDDTAKPDMVLEGYTFHAGESEEQQVGRIKNYSGTIDGTGNADETIFLSSKDRYIPAGVYMSESVKIEKVVTQEKSVDPSYETEKTVTPDAGKFLSKVIVFAATKPQFVFWSDVLSIDDREASSDFTSNTLAVEGFDFSPMAVFWMLQSRSNRDDDEPDVAWHSQIDGGMMCSGYAIREGMLTSGSEEGRASFLVDEYLGSNNYAGAYDSESMGSEDATLTWVDPTPENPNGGKVKIKMSFDFQSKDAPEGIDGNDYFSEEYNYRIVVVGMK